MTFINIVENIVKKGIASTSQGREKNTKHLIYIHWKEGDRVVGVREIQHFDSFSLYPLSRYTYPDV